MSDKTKKITPDPELFSPEQAARVLTQASKHSLCLGQEIVNSYISLAQITRANKAPHANNQERGK